MPSYPFETVDVFTDRRFGGNPLAVFPDARGLSDSDMQALATEFNPSETTFVLPAEDAHNTARIRIFNRTHEMPFAGHPMVGTAFVLARRGSNAVDEFRFEVPAGVVQIRLNRVNGVVDGAIIDAPEPLTLGVTLDAEQIARSIGISAAEVVSSNHPPTLASVGHTYVIAEVTADALDQATPDLGEFRRALASEPGLNGRYSLYIYARNGAMISARMFAPIARTFEDPATGRAATPLAALLLSLTDGGSADFEIHQGGKMGRPSVLHASAYRAHDGIRARVGGSCVSVLRGDATL